MKLRKKKENCIKKTIKFSPDEYPALEWILKRAKKEKRGFSPMAVIVIEEAKEKDEEEGFKDMI